MSGRLVVLTVAVVGFVVWAVFFRETYEDEQFNRARRDGIEGLLRFQKSFPDGDRSGDAKRAIAKLIRIGQKQLGAQATGAGDPASEASSGLQGMNALLDTLAERGDPRVHLSADTPDTTALIAADAQLATGGPADTYFAPMAKHFGPKTWRYQYAFKDGFKHVFEPILGPEVVSFPRYGEQLPEDGGFPTFALSFVVRPSERVFARANSKRSFVAVACDVTLVVTTPERDLFTFRTTVEPESDFSFSSHAMRGMFTVGNPDSDSLDSDVYKGMLDSLFREFARALLAHVTGAADTGPTPRSELARAREWCEEQRDGRSCTVLGLAYLEGHGVGQDKARAARLFQQSCMDFGTGAGSCVPLAWMHLKGEGGLDPSSHMAELLLDYGCKGGEPAACRMRAGLRLRESKYLPYMGDREGRPGDPEGAVLDLVRACDQGLTDACGRAAELYDGAQLPSDNAIAGILANRACRGGARGYCQMAETLSKKLAKMPTTSVLGVAIPEDVSVFDVRYAMVFANSPTLQVWLASPRPGDSTAMRDMARDAPESTDVTIVDVRSDKRPTTAQPPPGTRTLIGIAPNSGTERCRGCGFAGVPVTFGCECRR